VSRRTLEDHLSSYYADKTLPPQTAEHLSALARVGPDAAPHRATRTWSTGSVLALAACVTAVSVIGTRLMVAPPASSRNAAEVPSRMVGGDPGAKSPDHPADAERPRLVAVKFEVAGCPNSMATERTFAKLEQEYGDQCVLFTRLDISDKTKSQQSKYLTHLLGIDCVYDGACQSGTLMLVDRKKAALLAVASSPQQVPKWESALAAAVK